MIREFTEQELEDAVAIQREKWMQFVLEQVEQQAQKMREKYLWLQDITVGD